MLFYNVLLTRFVNKYELSLFRCEEMRKLLTFHYMILVYSSTESIHIVLILHYKYFLGDTAVVFDPLRIFLAFL